MQPRHRQSNAAYRTPRQEKLSACCAALMCLWCGNSTGSVKGSIRRPPSVPGWTSQICAHMHPATTCAAWTGTSLHGQGPPTSGGSMRTATSARGWCLTFPDRWFSVAGRRQNLRARLRSPGRWYDSLPRVVTASARCSTPGLHRDPRAPFVTERIAGGRKARRNAASWHGSMEHHGRTAVPQRASVLARAGPTHSASCNARWRSHADCLGPPVTGIPRTHVTQ